MQFNVMVAKVEDVANIEQRPTMEARTMALLLAPKPVVFQRLASLRAQQERDREKARAAGHPVEEHDEELDEEEEDEDLDDDEDDDEDEDDEN